MSLSSYEFVLVFLPVSVLGFWRLNGRFGRSAGVWWLIGVSIVFYAYASVTGLMVLLPSIGLDLLVARGMLRSDISQARRQTALYLIGIIANILLLGYFKYKNFFLGTLDTVFGARFPLTPVLMSLGISFLTFQKIAFLSDVQSGVIDKIPLRDFLLFTLFFPRTLAGPIVHYQEVMPQFASNDSRECLRHVGIGVALFSIGLFKKAVIADGVAEFVPYRDVGPIPCIFAWTGTLAYLLQLYFDFSGYSDMALGAARFFGIRLPMNFNSPLKATSIVDFWSRWHITLTRFLTSYVYTPLVLLLTRYRINRGKPVLRGKRSKPSAIGSLVAAPTLVTMAVSGLWHGAGWQFVVWGLMHGIYLTINQTWRVLRPRFWANQASYERFMAPVGFVLTFFAVLVSTNFFRADSLQSALSLSTAMMGLHGFVPYHVQTLQSMGLEFDWTAYWTPFASLRWLTMLFLAATLLPNSLELLRQFSPALDFPGTGTERVGRAEKEPVKSSWIHQCGMRIREGWAQVGREGLTANWRTAWLLATIAALGLMALSHTAKFIYGRF